MSCNFCIIAHRKPTFTERKENAKILLSDMIKIARNKKLPYKITLKVTTGTLITEAKYSKRERGYFSAQYFFTERQMKFIEKLFTL